MAAVLIEHLTKVFRGPRGEPIRAVTDFNLAVEDRELLTLVGPSGCGKTTLLRLIAGLEQPDSGALTLQGRLADPLRAADREVALVFQHGALYPHMTVHQNLTFPLKVRGVPKAEAATRVRDATEMLGLADCLRRRPAELSGGQRQRVALGRALVRHPKLLLLDEPLSNLDEPRRAELRGELLRLHARSGATFIHVTHDQDEAMALGQRVAVMHAGVLQQVDRPLTVYRRPANLVVAGFIGSPPMNLVRGAIHRDAHGLCFHPRVAGGGQASVEAALPLAEEPAARLGAWDGRPVVLGLRPEEISLPVGDEPSRGPPRRDAVVEGLEPGGYETRVRLAFGGASWIARVRSAAGLAVGEKTTVRFNLRSACFFDAVSGQAIA